MIRKIKALLLDSEYQEPNTPTSSQRDNRRVRRGENQRQGSRKQRKNRLMELAILGFLLAVAAVILFGNNHSNVIAIDSVSLCPINNEDIARKTYILIDLSEPLEEEQRIDLINLLEKIAENMETRELLSISQMQTLQNAPRKEVQRFCSPDISRIGQVGSRINNKDCDAIVKDEDYAWPLNVGEAVREDIRVACRGYLKHKHNVNEAAKRYELENSEQSKSYIIGSIEDTMVDANDEPSNAPTRLIVFSDMLQNADWFSQYRKQHGEWTIKNLRERRKNVPAMGAQPDNNFDEVLLCYLPSVHPSILATSRRRKQHRQMWKDYFSENPNVRYTSTSGRQPRCADYVEI